MAELKNEQVKNCTPKNGAPEHVNENMLAGGPKEGHYNSAEYWCKDNRGQKGNACYTEAFPDLHDTAVLFIEYGLSLGAPSF